MSKAEAVGKAAKKAAEVGSDATKKFSKRVKDAHKGENTLVNDFWVVAGGFVAGHAVAAVSSIIGQDVIAVLSTLAIGITGILLSKDFFVKGEKDAYGDPQINRLRVGLVATSVITGLFLAGYYEYLNPLGVIAAFAALPISRKINASKNSAPNLPSPEDAGLN